MKSKTEINPECGLRLKEVLGQKKISQLELSKLSGFTPQYISYIIQGLRPMTVSAANAFSKALNIRQEYLLCEDNYKNKYSLQESLKIQTKTDYANAKLDHAFHNSLSDIVSTFKEKCSLAGLICSEESLNEFYKDIENYINMRFEKWLVPHSQECVLKVNDLAISDGYLKLDSRSEIIHSIVETYKELLERDSPSATLLYNAIRDYASGKRKAPEPTPAERAQQFPDLIKKLKNNGIAIEFPHNFPLENIPESFYYACLGMAQAIDMLQELPSDSK